MVKVFVRHNEPIEDAIRKFKKKVEKAGISKKVKEKMYYTKPSQKKREAIAKAKRKLAKKQRRENKN